MIGSGNMRQTPLKALSLAKRREELAKRQAFPCSVSPLSKYPRSQFGFHSLPAAQSFINKSKLNFLKFLLNSLPLSLHFNGLILEQRERDEGMVFFYLVNKLLLLLMDILTVWRTKTGGGGEMCI